MPDLLRFDGFSLDPAERRLTREGKVVDLNARYFDALSLLVAERGRLVTKDRLLARVGADRVDQSVRVLFGIQRQ